MSISRRESIVLCSREREEEGRILAAPFSPAPSKPKLMIGDQLSNIFAHLETCNRNCNSNKITEMSNV